MITEYEKFFPFFDFFVKQFNWIIRFSALIAIL
jgi:hypothetical protein